MGSSRLLVSTEANYSKGPKQCLVEIELDLAKEVSVGSASSCSVITRERLEKEQPWVADLEVWRFGSVEEPNRVLLCRVI